MPSRTAEYYISSKRTHSLHASTQLPPITRPPMPKVNRRFNFPHRRAPITRHHMRNVKDRLEFSRGGAFAKMSKTEQDDLRIVTLAFNYATSFFQYASPRVRHNKHFILSLLADNAHLMFYVPDNLKQDPVFMLKAVAANFRALYYADWLIRNDSAFLYKAIRVHEHAIWMLPEHVTNTLACETKLAAALYLYLIPRLPLELCQMVFQMQ